MICNSLNFLFFLAPIRSDLPSKQFESLSTNPAHSSVPVTCPKNPGRNQHIVNIDLKNCPPSDIIIKGFNEVKDGQDLEDYIDPENGLLSQLQKNSIIDDSEIETLKLLTPYQTLNEELLRKIKRNIKSICQQFIRALCQDEQAHIAEFIISGGCNTDSDNRLLPRDLRDVIDDNMICLKGLIDTEKHDFLLILVREKCITKRHRDRVFRTKPEERAYELLIILQRRRHRDFVIFMDCLRKTMQNNIIKVLEKGQGRRNL